VTALQWLRHSVATVHTALSNARRDRITGLGAEVAFFAAMAHLWAGGPGCPARLDRGSHRQGLAERAEAVLLDLFRSILTEDFANALAGVRRLFEEERRGLLTLGVASTLLALVRAFSAVFRALVSCTRSACHVCGGGAVPGRSPFRS
jgi:uncharacterized BrkB/YihY/UPF0761 family membrane protein